MEKRIKNDLEEMSNLWANRNKGKLSLMRGLLKKRKSNKRFGRYFTKKYRELNCYNISRVIALN